ncbi:MAG: helix-turn-helix transcriptional regulator [Deltaproteobacteria bacterium]|nr:helix-turn-helix transcriptional regulator [Deltaproteobacteria bacterium]
MKKKEKKTIEQQFGETLRQLRAQKGLSQEELGFESGYHRTYISLLERGKKSPSIKTIFQLANALNIKPSELIELMQVDSETFK